MSNLALKIYLADSDITKTCQYTSDMYVQDIIQDIREKHSYGEGGLDFGLFIREQNLWLASNKLLDHYDLRTGDVLEFRKRHRVLKVKMLDDSMKAILVDESQPVRVVVAAVCERIGISNDDEYSLASDKTLTLNKKGDKKAKQKEAVYTEGPAWLNPDKTLREQGLTESDAVILKKKFFFTDQNVDRSDPVQMMLMYNQSHEMIVSGKQPCTGVESAQLGAIQLQIQYGNHEPDKHKPGFVKVKDYIPPEYHKNKDIEKRMYNEHSKLHGMSELNAKFRYVQMCRSLKTYGTTFFVVKEPAAKRKKATTMLLGVTKQSILRVDLETKEIVQEWKLTQIRRWAATAKTFTLDFGDHSENYYSVESTEGDQISRLISGYIDIIVKKRNQKSRTVEEARVEEQAVIEDYVRPGRANNVEVVATAGGARRAKESHTGGAMFVDDEQSSNYQKTNRHQNSVPQGEIAQNLDIVEFQQAIIQTINNGLAVAAAAYTDLSVPTHLPSMTNDPATVKWRQETCDITSEAVASNIAASLAAVGTLIIHATGNVDDMDYNTIGSKLFTVISAISQITQGMKMLSGLQVTENDQERLLRAAKMLTETISKVLRDLLPIISGSLVMDDFYGATKNLAGASSNVLLTIDHLDVTYEQQQMLYQAAESIANAVAAAVDRTKSMATTIREPETQQMCLSDSILCSEISSMLTAVTVALAPTVHTPLCRELLVEGCTLMRDSALALVSYSDQATNPKIIVQLQDAVDLVEKAISDLLACARFSDMTLDSEIEGYYDEIAVSLDQLIQSLDNSDNMIAHTKQITISATRLAEVLKLKADTLETTQEQNLLIDDARMISELIARLVEDVKGFVKSPNSPEVDQSLERTVLDFKDLVDRVCGSFIKASLTHRLVQSLRSTMASSNQLMSSSRNCASFNRDQGSQIHLHRAIKKVVDCMPKVVRAIKGSTAKPNDYVACVSLTQASRSMLDPGMLMVDCARTAALTTVDSDAQHLLLTATQQLVDELQNMCKILDIYEQICAAEELVGAEISLKTTLFDISKARSETAQPFISNPVSSEELMNAETSLAQLSKDIQQSLKRIQAAVIAGDERATGTAITEVIAGLQSLSVSSITISSSVSEVDQRHQLLDSTALVCESVSRLIQAAKHTLANQTGQDNEDFDKAIKETRSAIAGTLDCLPGQRALVLALGKLKDITTDMEISRMVNAADPSAVVTNAAQEQLQTKLVDAAIGLAAATNTLVVASRGDPVSLQRGVEKIEVAFGNLAQASVVLASIQSNQAEGNREKSEDITGLVRAVGLECNQFLNSLKGCTLEPDDTGLTGLLLTAAKSVGSTVDDLLGKLEVSVPGYDQCARVMQSIGETTVLLNETNTLANAQGTYSETVQNMTTAETTLTDILNTMTAHASAQNGIKVADTLVKLAETVGKYTKQTVHAAQLIALSDPMSEAPISSTIDRKMLLAAGQELSDACKKLVNQDNSQSEILKCASVISKQTTAIVNLCKLASQDPKLTLEARQEFETYSKKTVAKTVQLVGAIKRLAVENNESSRVLCEETSKQLTIHVDEIVAVTSSPEYAGAPAKISEQAIQIQRPVLDNAHMLLAELQDITLLSQNFCANPDSDDLRLMLIEETKTVSKIVGNMLNSVKDAGPGQKACQEATDRINETIVSIDTAITQAVSGGLVQELTAVNKSVDKHALRDHLQALSNLAEVVACATRGDMIQLTSAIEEMPMTLNKTANLVLTYGATTDMKSHQRELLESTKALSDALSSYITVVKTDCADPNEFGIFQIEAEKMALKSAIATVVGLVDGPSDPYTLQISRASEKVEELLVGLDNRIKHSSKNENSEAILTERPYQVVVLEIKQSGKKIIGAVGHILSKQCKMEDLSSAAEKISAIYEELTLNTSAAIDACNDDDLKKQLLHFTREVGGSTLKVIDVLRQGTGKESLDPATRLKLNQAVRTMYSKLDELNSAADEGSKGLLACQAANTHLDDMISELETTTIFAQAKQLDSVDTTDNFSLYKDQLLLSVEKLTDLIDGFSKCNKLTQDELALMLNESVSVMSVFKENVQKATASITSNDSNSQMQLLALSKDILTSMQELVKSSGKATGTNDISAYMDSVKQAIAVQQVASKAFKDYVTVISDDSQRASRTADNVIEEINSACQIMNDKDAPALGTALPEEIISFARTLTGAAAAIIGAATISSKQETLAPLMGNLGKVINELARAGKAATDRAPEENKIEIAKAITHAGNTCKDLIVCVKTIHAGSTADAKMQLQTSAKNVTTAVTEVVSAAGKLMPGGYVDPNDPNVIAERKLLSAAIAIEQAAKRLAEFKPAEGPRKANDELKFDEQIFEAAKAIAAATSALIRSATGAQREIIAKGRAGKTDAMYHSDGTWNDGLVSAAKQVAASTSELCEAANEVVKGSAQHDRVIVCARNVSSFTVQLLTAAAVRSDSSSQTQIRLRAAGKAVTDATEQLVEAAKGNNTIQDNDMSAVDAELFISPTKSKVLEMEAQMNILRMEKELERARVGLAAVRKGRYAAVLPSNTPPQDGSNTLSSAGQTRSLNALSITPRNAAGGVKAGKGNTDRSLASPRPSVHVQPPSNLKPLATSKHHEQIESDKQ
ncbi:hypothetical protein MT418_000678 [Batrachochytrium dendrobatidis]